MRLVTSSFFQTEENGVAYVPFFLIVSYISENNMSEKGSSKQVSSVSTKCKFQGASAEKNNFMQTFEIFCGQNIYRPNYGYQRAQKKKDISKHFENCRKHDVSTYIQRSIFQYL